jgi:LmbE family N-acetylglucosaminyl deacetylase
MLSGRHHNSATAKPEIDNRSRNLIVRPELVEFGSGKRVLLMARRLEEGMMASGGSVIGCTGNGGQLSILVLEDESESYGTVKSIFEGGGTASVTKETVSEGDRSNLHDRSPEIVFVPSPMEDREAYRTFSGILKDEIGGTSTSIQILLYELRAPIVPDLVVDITSVQPNKERLLERGSNVDLCNALNQYRSVTNMMGRGFAEAFRSISPRDLAVGIPSELESLTFLDRGPIRFFRGLELFGDTDISSWQGGDKNRRVLVMAPHFDDETIGVGGTIYRHVQRGDPTAVLFFTDGREGDPRESDRDLVSVIRRQEAVEAADTLGIRNLEFLDQPETMLGPCRELEKRIEEIIVNIDPQVIYLPSFIDNHIDHIELNRIFYRVLRNIELEPEIRLFGIWTLIPPNFLVDIGNEIDVKINAINKYRSQITQVDYLSVTMALNRFWSVMYGDGEGYLETFYILKREKYFSIIETLGLDQEMEFKR